MHAATEVTLFKPETNFCLTNNFHKMNIQCT